jgi:hypothetical protein
MPRATRSLDCTTAMSLRPGCSRSAPSNDASNIVGGYPVDRERWTLQARETPNPRAQAAPAAVTHAMSDAHRVKELMADAGLTLLAADAVATLVMRFLA